MMSNKEKRILLPDIYQNHMMLQREKKLRICGLSTDAVTSVTVELSGCEKNGINTQSDDQTATQRVTVPVNGGSFFCIFPPQKAAREQILRFYANDESHAEITITNVSIGDIWMACGQSNMEYFLRYDAHWNDIKREPFNPDIHMYNVSQIAYEGQKKNCPGSGYWFMQGDSAWPVFSAPGYCFARKIQEQYGIPIGIIGCNWGGTPACAWVDESYLQAPLDIYLKEYEEEVKKWDPEDLKTVSLRGIEFQNSYRSELEWRCMMYGMTWEEQQLWMKEHEGEPAIPMGPYHQYRPCGVYHTMLRKIAPFSVKGVLWYQGESDAAHADMYDIMFRETIRCFRDTWLDKTLPFLFVQLAPFARMLDLTGENYEIIREKQDQVSKEVPETYMISIMDLGEHDDIHPKYKREVGERLALLAMGTVYGENILCESPELKKVAVTGKEITLTFSHAEGGLKAADDASDAFVVLQDSKRIPVKKLSVSGEQLVLTLAEPLSDTEFGISLAYEPYCEIHIWNQAGLPVKPFRYAGNSTSL